MEIETVVAGNEALGLEDVAAQLIDVACGTGEVAGALDAAAHGAGLHLEAVHVVCLPAMEGEMEVLQLFQYLLGVHTDFCITLSGHFIGLFYQCFFHFRCECCLGFLLFGSLMPCTGEA